MNTEYFIIYYCCKWQEIKYLCTIPPNIYGTIFPETLIIKPIDLGDLPTFVIASDEGNPVLIPDFQS